jgi:RHS repeat-associated protein
VNSPTSLTATVTVSPIEGAFSHSVTVATGGEVARGTFNVTPGPATLISVSPNSGSQGRQNVTLTITGQATHFQQGKTGLSSDALSLGTPTVNSPTSLTVNAIIPVNATLGLHSITATTVGEVATLTNAFNVTTGVPTLFSASPSTEPQSTPAVNISISGEFSHFAQGVSVADFGPGVIVNSLTVSSATGATANITVDPLAQSGQRNVTVTTGSEAATLINGFTVVPSSATITSFTPASLPQGQQNATVTITGSATHFAQNISAGAFGAGITVNSLTVASPTSATAVVSVDPAASGSRIIAVVTQGETALSGNSLGITTGTPELTLLTPGSAQPGTQNLSVAITGFKTSFAQGTSVANFGAGITVASLTVNSATSATAVVNIDPAATLGPRSVSVTTGTQTATFTNGFLVAPPPPGVSINLTEGQEITKPTAIVGSVSAGNWVLSYALASQDGTGAAPVFVPFASGTTAVSNGVLGTFDPILLLNGNYIIQLSSTDQFGQISTISANVEVERNVKVGNFTLSFNDLNVPMPGLPITVTRTYDSRDKQSHDFGVGWTLSLVNVRLQKNGVLGARWQMTQSGTGTATSFCLQETKPHFVTITFPDGRVFKFQETTTPQCQQISPIESANLGFVELPGASGTQGATLTIVGNNNVLVTPPSVGPVDLLDSVTTQEANPMVFQLTTAEGFVYVIDQTLGATSVTDPNGNQLTINSAGITSSDGKSVAFKRDTQGRITQIADPAGNVLNYSYNGTGDLSTFVDRVGNITTFSYGATHLLTNIADPRGIQAVKNLYDSSGRLTDTIDADGHDVHYDHQLSANTEVITDRLGHVTTYEYDDDGNILHKIQTVAGVQIDTAYTYDGNDNKLSELLPGHLNPSTFTYDALGDQLTQTDPLGNETKYAYNANRQVTTIDDANLGAQHGTTTNTYDAHANLLSTTDAEGHVTAYTYFANGQVKTVSVDGVQTGSFVYDATGNLVTQTDANGVPTTYTYDANGNRTSQTVNRTLPGGTVQSLVTSYAYDASNLLIKTTYPDGTSSQIKYNAIGKQSDVIDPLGHTTHYDYDNQGRLSKTTYAVGTADSSFELTGYDLEGRRASFQDRAGRTTTYDYDEIGRLIKTHYPDTTFIETVYDGSGRATDSFDGLRHQTHYDYDDADRRIKVTDAAGNQTSFAYDNVGNQTSMTDALLHTTQFSYDRLGRRTLTTYPDQSTASQHYDFLGRVDSKTDQAGKITGYGYDNLGRLTSVTQTLNPGAANAQNLVTSYGYDEVGERISQTDANGHVTKFAYDQLGRRSSRTLPLGQSESYAYDAAGNLKQKTDFNGHTTTYAYDNMNRLKSKTADAFFLTGTCAGGACGATSVSFTYTNTGRRFSMTDGTGITNYTYDLLDRLKTKATPFGNVSYTYDFAGNMLTLGSSNVGGASMTYAYDALNRLATVTDAFGTGGALETTTYSYDAVGNLAGYSYPNGVSTGYSYDPLNRLTSMQSSCGTGTGCAAPNTVISSYAYTLGPSGNRLSVAELSGRSVTYGYDDLYRLTSETVASDPGGNNGQVSYTLDNVGNRLQRNSTLSAIVPTGLLSYDANDRVSTDSYDANGNTTINSGQTNVYDFENRLVQRGGVTLVYDGDGNRVKETVGGVTTSYLVADQNPTGYAQVLDELQGGAVTRTYSYGLELINERQNISGTLTTSFYGYDGHGSVRFLTSSTGAITDTYDYDAFGNLISSTGSTPNNYLFAGEQFDPALGIYYNRARYYDQRQGRFWTMDTYEGHDDEPTSLHKYLYVYENPVDNIDRCGKCVPSTGNYGEIVQSEIFKDFVSKKPAGVLTNTAISTILGQTVPGGGLLPDLIDPVTLSDRGFGEIWEIKSIYSAPAAEAKLALYLIVLNKYSRILKWIPGVSYVPPPVIRIDSDVIATTEEPAPGVITYCVLSLDEMERLVVLAQQAMLADLFISLATAEVEEAYAQ